MIEKNKVYRTTLIEAEGREKWLRVAYEVKMIDNGAEFDCECGQFEHMGLLCCHVLRVMDYLDILEIPKKHIVKRWTRNARDVLPMAAGQGAASAEAYDGSMGLFKENVPPYGEARDCLGLKDRPTSKRLMANERLGDCSVHNNDTVLTTQDQLVGLAAPCKKPKPGRPTALQQVPSREEAPYEEMSKGTCP